MKQRTIIKHSVVDAGNHRIPLAIIPASDPKNSPILFVFHGWTGGLNVDRNFDTLISPAHANEFPDNWTIVLPQDRYGFARCGCWWLGEKGVLFMPPLLDNLLRTIGQTVGFNGDVYTYGTSMGGFAALLYGLRWKAKAVCANVPQVRLVGSELDGRLIRFVFGEENCGRILAGDPEVAELARYADVTNFIDPSLPARDLPTFLIHQSRHDVTPNYTREHCFHLVDALLAAKADFELHVLPEASHREYVGAVAAIEWFEEKSKIIHEGIENHLLKDETDPNKNYASMVLDQYAKSYGI